MYLVGFHTPSRQICIQAAPAAAPNGEAHVQQGEPVHPLRSACPLKFVRAEARQPGFRPDTVSARSAPPGTRRCPIIDPRDPGSKRAVLSMRK